MTRDLIGYGEEPPVVAWPGGARLAVSIALNYEEGAERSIASGDEVEEDVRVFGTWSAPIDQRSQMRESFFEYGSRVGIWRLLGLLADAKVPATIFACGQALERNPPVAEALGSSGHEICSHGYRWRGLVGMDPAEQLAEIRRSVRAIETTTGRSPVGWYCRDGITEGTRDLLAAEGFMYDSNSYADDLPYFVPTANGRHLVVPYASDTNDARFWGEAGFATAADFYTVLVDSLDMLLEEGETVPKMMSVGLHTRIGGRPAIAIALHRFLRTALARDGVWFATREQIARWWIEHAPADLGRHKEGAVA